MGSMAASRAAPRAGASPAPTIYGWALRSCIVGLTLAVNLGAARDGAARPVTGPIQLALSFANKFLERVPVLPVSLSFVIGSEGAQPLGIFP